MSNENNLAFAREATRRVHDHVTDGQKLIMLHRVLYLDWHVCNLFNVPGGLGCTWVLLPRQGEDVNHRPVEQKPPQLW